MYRISYLTAVILAITLPAHPQDSPARPPLGLATFLQNSYQTLKANLTESAELMASEDYDSKPSSMTEVRTYGQLFAHVAASQFATCASLRDASNPNQDRELEEELTTKAEIQKALSDSFELCDVAYASVTDANAMDLVQHNGMGVAKAVLLTYNLVHGSEMYGISTVYLRAKNLVPPSTEREARRRRAQQEQH